MKVIFLNSDSFFLNKAADMVSNSVDTVLIQNYTPSRIMVRLLTVFDTIFKTRFRRLQGRRCKSTKVEVHSLLTNDILKALCNFAVKAGLPKDKLDAFIARNYGKSASNYLCHADVLHLRSGYGQGGALEKARNAGMRIIVDHSIACTEEIDKILGPEYKRYGIKNGIKPDSEFWRLVIRDCDEADIILVNSDYVKETFLRHGYEKNKIIVNYLGVREDWFSIKKNYELADGLLKILFVGEFGIRKGAEYLLKASQLLNHKNIKYKIVVIGPLAEIDDVLRNTDVSHFEFVGKVLYEDLKKYYSQCDVYLFPSLCEGSTRAGMEAMAAGLPVIFTDNCGCPVQDGINGLIVPIKDERAIANAVERLYSSEELRRKIGEAAAKTIAQNYTWEHYKNNLLSIYQSLEKY